MRTSTDESYLEQYASIFDSVEINSSFYRHHQHKTYARWAASVPESFRFSVKLPKSITHTEQPFGDTLTRFFDETDGLERKFEILLLQFPPKKEFDEKAITDLLQAVRKRFQRKVVCEPRHKTFFEHQAIASLDRYSVSLVIADPPVVPNAPKMHAAREGNYFRLHGSPRLYYSDYQPEFLEQLKGLKALQSTDTWVIFDNTALGHAFRNAKAIIKKMD